MSGRILDNRYELGEALGRGGHATVWRGRDLRLDRPVAVKMLDRSGLADETASERFRREARTVARLAHTNIVAVYDFGEHGGTPYLVMELVEGQSLAAILAGGPMPIREVVAVAVQVCDALAAAHAAGVVHRDVKPANILVTTAGVAKVCDFGIARLERATGQATLTGPATAVGTSDYMAPEQAVGDPVDARTDLYALGCVLYAMLTGTPPFTGDDALGVIYQHLHRTAAPVQSLRAGIDDDLAALVSVLLAKDPAERPADAAQVRARLTVLAGGSAGVAVSAAGGGAGIGGFPATMVGPGPATPERAGVPGAEATSPAPAVPRARASAAVPTPTRTMPVLPAHGEDDEPPGGRDRFALSPGTMAALAVAVLVLVIAAVGVTALLVRGTSHSNAAPPNTASPSTGSTGSATPSPSPLPTDPIAFLQAVVGQQAQDGQIRQDLANELIKQLREIRRNLNKHQDRQAAGKVADLQSKLGELEQSGKITSTAYDELTQVLAQLADTLPATKGGDN